MSTHKEEIMKEPEDQNINCSAGTANTTETRVSSVDTVDISDDNTGSIAADKPMETSEQSSNSATPVLDEAHGTASLNPNVRIKMLARITMSGAHFKHQQIGEPELSMEEKVEIAQKVLDSSKVNFLARFWNYLELEDLEFFEDCKDVYEIDFYLKQIHKHKSGQFQKNRVKNRRYEAMKELIFKDEYFSEDEMKFRDPYLYDQMIGQYLTDDEIHAKVEKSDLRFSTILIKHVDQLDENARFSVDKDKEEGQEEEEEDSDEEESDMEDDLQQDEDGNEQKISDEQKQELRAEFLTLMQEKFLQGKDKGFDYSKVDNNEAYDDLTVLNNDEEEKYFDGD